MTPKQERLIKAQIRGLRPAVIASGDRNCHWTLGQSLNALRETVLNGLSEEERSIASTGMPPIEVRVPRDGGGEFTVPPCEALRLLCQLEEVMGGTS